MKFYIILSLIIGLTFSRKDHTNLPNMQLDGSYDGLCWNICKYICWECFKHSPSGFNNEGEINRNLICICHNLQKDVETKYQLAEKHETLFARSCKDEFKEKIRCDNYMPKSRKFKRKLK